jgi:hypothetical protein
VLIADSQWSFLVIFVALAFSPVFYIFDTPDKAVSIVVYGRNDGVALSYPIVRPLFL